MASSPPSSDPRRPWWATWPACLAWGVLSLLAVLPAVLGWALYALYDVANTTGIDMTVDAGTAPTPLRLLAVVAALASLTLPVFVTRWARKVWLGYTLLGWILSGVVLLVGLGMFNIL
ncbi:hypothetical protein [uncultured Tessaracoccus sp.]|uniref:hypothetical protein n=1 Tax=uncultured Tessaracoccus sp. TaxID=905023 RepID=UPI0025DE23CA|nr:hypothetical protein [uncultured Tessaracoccus sp.]